VRDVWSGRAEAYRDSSSHARGPDLDRFVEWCEPGDGVTALDVATGGGHVARRLRDAGCVVVTVDAAPGMQPDVIARSEELPFAAGAFEVVACRLAAHHFDDAGLGVAEMARVAGDRVVVQDLLYVDDRVEEAEQLRDPSHVRSYSEREWGELLEGAGLAVDRHEIREKRPVTDDWVARTGCAGDDAVRVRELLSHRMDADGNWLDHVILLRGRKAAA
jgi:SAM-dependent methyltransferase